METNDGAGVEYMRDSGAPWVSWILLVVCFMLAVPASVPETDAPASAPAQVEVEPEETGMPVVALRRRAQGLHHRTAAG